MSLISEISSLFHFSPQIHRQAWMDICWKWHWNSRNQQFCTGIDPSPFTQVCNIYLCIPALVLAPWTVFFTVFYCSNCICSLLGMIFGLGSVTFFVKWILLQHPDQFLIISDWAYGELNLMRNSVVQQHSKPPLLPELLQAWEVCDYIADIVHILRQISIEQEYDAIPLVKEELQIIVQHGIYVLL